MSTLREIELDILQSFIEVCEALSIRYFVVEGTLLGAVRHGGFIPWDDDIDVGMLRSDYEVFLERGQELLPEHLFVQTHETDPNYPHSFGKIRDTRTSFVETTMSRIPMEHGVYIDVFPFDYYPQGKLRSLMFDIKKFWLRYRIRSVFFDPSLSRMTPSSLAKRGLMLLARFITPSLEEAYEKQERLFAGQKASPLVANNGSPWGKREVIPAAWVEEVTPVAFEGIGVAAPSKYREYLSRVYGDYMSMPPPEERVPHHFVSFVDFNGLASEGLK